MEELAPENEKELQANEPKKTAAQECVRRFLSCVGGAYSRIKPYLCRWIWGLPPVIVLCAMLILFKVKDLYPFSDRSISWGDMDQQYIPLLLNFKDILAGKDGFFFSVKSAAGMNFYGVFFYFLSSPFTFLVLFVEKAEMSSFVNILVMLKMCAIAGTASFYLSRKYPSAPLLNVFLSVLYAYSGYSMMYYQIIGWLDVVYLFPLLLMGLEKLKEGKRTLFMLTLSASMIVNYYLGYMLVIFLLLYASIYLIMTKDKRFAGNFCLCCFVAALVSAIVWLPSFLQYFSSGRKTSLLENLAGTQILTSYTTTMQTVLSMLFLFPFALSYKKHEAVDSRLRYWLFILTLVPFILEPINKMWHTGNYMCFPTRYSFMTLFLCITLAMDVMTGRKKEELPEEVQRSRKEKNWKKEVPMYALNAVLVGISIAYCCFAIEYTKENAETMDQYSHSLWGNDASFTALLRLYVLALAVGVLWYVFHKYKLFKPVFLWLSVGVLVLSELYVAPMTYMVTPGHETAKYRDVVQLADVIDDAGFYRVKSDKEYSGRDFDVNHMSGIGYNALGHFTSLTNDNYMTAIKQFGYTSYWMEVGNSGGTVLSDALLSVKYCISSKKSENAVYEGNYYSIAPTVASLPLGVVTERDIISAAATADHTHRGEFQKTLAQDFFGTSGFVTTYTVDDATVTGLTVTETEKGYLLKPTSSSGGKLTFRVAAAENQAVYFNVFDQNTNALTQSINDKFSITAPQYAVSSFPVKKSNGLLYLGEYDGAHTVTVTVKQEAHVQDIGLIGIATDELVSAVAETPSVGLRAVKNGYTGKYEAQGGECVFLSVPYDSGLTLKINGKKAELHEVYDGFVAFYLQAGENRIEIGYCSPGFVGGAVLCVVGVGLCVAAFVLWVKKKRRLELPPVANAVGYWTLIAAGGIVLVMIYIFPLVASIL